MTTAMTTAVIVSAATSSDAIKTNRHVGVRDDTELGRKTGTLLTTRIG